MKTLFVAALLIVTGYGCASNAQVASDAALIKWTNATQLTDGAPIPAAPDPLSLKTTRVQRSVASTCGTGAFGTVAQVWNVTSDVHSILLEGLRPAGKHCFRAAHIQANGSMSAWSAVVSKTIVIPTPKTKPPVTTIE